MVLLLFLHAGGGSGSHVPSGGWKGAGGSLSGGRVDASPRGGLSARAGPAGGRLQALPRARRGSFRLPLRLLAKLRAASSKVATVTKKAEPCFDRAPGDTSGRSLTRFPPKPRCRPPGQNRVSIEANSLRSITPRSQHRCIIRDAIKAVNIPVNSHAPQKLASRATKRVKAGASKTS